MINHIKNPFLRFVWFGENVFKCGEILRDMGKFIEKIKKFQEKVEDYKESRRKKRWEKNRKKEKKLLQEINIQMPFLFTTFYKGKERKSLDSLERIKMYYEIKSIKSQRRNDIVIPILTGIIIILTILQVVLLFQTSSLLTPDLKVKIEEGSNNRFFLDSELVSLYHDENWSFYPYNQEIDFVVNNKGRGNSDELQLSLIDLKGIFRNSYGGDKISSFEDEFIPLKLTTNNCSFGGNGKEEYLDAKKERCNPELIEKGLKELILVIDCPSCEIQKECYSFNICIYNQSVEEKWCEKISNKNDIELKKTNCPKD